MGNKELILTEARNFGEIITDTFSFVRINFRRFLLSILYFAGPFILISAMFTAFVNYDTLTGNNDDYSFTGPSYQLIYFNYLFKIFEQLVIVVVVYNFVSLSVKEGNSGTRTGRVGIRSLATFPKSLFFGILMTIIILIGFVLLIVPGVYLYVSLGFLIFVAIHEKKRFFAAMTRSFELAHFQWWLFFLLSICWAGINYAFGIGFAMPAQIVNGAYSYLSITGGDFPAYMIYIGMFLTVIQEVGTSMLLSLPAVSTCIFYFTTVEKKETPALLHRIELIGEHLRNTEGVE